MSRVAKALVSLPANVEYTAEDDIVTVKGPKGTISSHFNKLVEIANDEADPTKVKFNPTKDDPEGWAQAGTLRAIFSNMVHGVTQGFSKTLELVGVGYRAQAQGSKLSMSLGLSHPIEITLPKEVAVTTPTSTTIVLTSIDKQLLGQVASNIRSFRTPEPYKGKGIKYANEIIVRKEAKKK